MLEKIDGSDDDRGDQDYDIYHAQSSKKLQLGKETRKQNKFLAKIQNEHYLIKKESMGNYMTQTLPSLRLSPRKGSAQTKSVDELSDESSLSRRENGVKKIRNTNFTTFENKVQEMTLMGNPKDRKLNSKILSLIDGKEMMHLPDYAKTSLNLLNTELKTLDFEQNGSTMHEITSPTQDFGR